MFKAWIEVFLGAFETRHPFWEADADEIVLAYLLAGERGEEIHEIPFMIPLFHDHILARFMNIFCVSRIAISGNVIFEIRTCIFDISSNGLPFYEAWVRIFD